MEFTHHTAHINVHTNEQNTAFFITANKAQRQQEQEQQHNTIVLSHFLVHSPPSFSLTQGEMTSVMLSHSSAVVLLNSGPMHFF